MTAVLQSLPMVQAIMLLGIYALLPLVVVLSRYSIAMMVVAGMAIFTIKFWTVLWYLAMWVDQNLILSMYPGRQRLPANLRQPRRTRCQAHVAEYDYHQSLPGIAIVMEWHDGVGGVNVGRSINAVQGEFAMRAKMLEGRVHIGKAVVSKGAKR